MAANLPERVRLRTRLPSQGPVVLGNDAQVRQIVGNLVTNGLEAIGGEEGEISLTIGVADASEIGMTASAWSNWVPGAERMGNLDRA